MQIEITSGNNNRINWKVVNSEPVIERSLGEVSAGSSWPKLMRVTRACIHELCLTLAFVLLAVGSDAIGQNKRKPTVPESPDDVIRVSSNLVQTDVTVLDERGHFVNGLRREDFELRIDGKPQQISFFDRLLAGSVAEEAQLAATRRGSPAMKNTAIEEPLSDPGRIVFFYVDDLHLAVNSLVTARHLLLHYIEKDIGQNDEAAITSASGQIGFLQQVTDNKTVLEAAVERLKARPYLVRDFERPPMSEYQALAIERNNRDVIDYFVDELMKDLPSPPSIAAAQIGSLPRSRAEQQVRDRAHRILQQAAVVATSTLAGLESLVRSSAKLPGRKLVFLISDGFFLDNQNSDSLERLQQITSAAARSGVVIYSMDARGLVTGGADASSDVAGDPSGRLQRGSAGELVASQDTMNALANDTGGRSIFNSNALNAGLVKALEETSAYYLLAWRPETDEQKSEKFRRITVSIVGHPELKVRVRRGFFAAEPLALTKQAKVKEQSSAKNTADNGSENELRSAMAALFPERGLPLSLSLTYVNNPEKGAVLTVAVKVNANAPSLNTDEARQKAIVDLAGLVYNDEGKVGASFKDRLTIPALTAGPGNNRRNLIYNYPVTVPPGLYQVRVGARDQESGSVGTVQDWIEIPDISKRGLTLSSVIASERIVDQLAVHAATNGEAPPPLDQASLTVEHHFHRNSYLRFVVFLYSPAQADLKPDIAVQVQILRANQPVLTTSLRKVPTEGIADLTRLAYAAEISLEHLSPGRYVLLVTGIDRATKTTTSQRMRFEIL